MADRRDAVATLRLKGVSKRRACQILRLGRSSLYYRPRKDGDPTIFGIGIQEIEREVG